MLREVLDALLADTNQSPSWSNTQRNAVPDGDFKTSFDYPQDLQSARRLPAAACTNCLVLAVKTMQRADEVNGTEPAISPTSSGLKPQSNAISQHLLCIGGCQWHVTCQASTDTANSRQVPHQKRTFDSTRTMLHKGLGHHSGR